MSNVNNNLSLFNFQGHNIRIVIRNGEPWFVAKDICETLGIVNHKDAISRLPESQKSGVGDSDPHGREQLTTIISEVALYKLAFRSNKEEADVFTDWVASVGYRVMWRECKLMQEESKIFQTLFYQGHQIRTVEHKGETWWVAIDVCKVLEIVNVSHAINGNERKGELGLDDDEKDDIGIPDIMGRTQATLCVNEPGLYHLISKSRTPGAKAFGRWIRHEVLPAIRKTGRYSLTQEEPQKSHDQFSQWLNGGATLLRTLSRDEHMHLIHYQRAILSFLETSYNSKYPHIPDNNKYPREGQRPHQTETLALHPVETSPNLQTILLDYLQKNEAVTVRYLQQSGPRQLRNLPAEQLRTMLQALVESGALKIVQMGKAEGYQFLSSLRVEP